MTQPHVLALSSGRRAVPNGGGRPTAIDKRPVDAFEVRDPGPKRGGLGSGVVGDEIGNPKHHGGELQAVYAYPREDQEFWEQQIGRSIPSGGFGENITTWGVDGDPRSRRRALEDRGRRAAGRGPPHPVPDVRRAHGRASMGAAVHRGRAHRRLPLGRHAGRRAQRRRDRGRAARPRHRPPRCSSGPSAATSPPRDGWWTRTSSTPTSTPGSLDDDSRRRGG